MGMEKDDIVVGGSAGSDNSMKDGGLGKEGEPTHEQDTQAFYHSHDVFGGEEGHDVSSCRVFFYQLLHLPFDFPSLGYT